MAFTDLSYLDLLRGSLSLTFIIISLIIGLRILLKYFKYKNKVFITVSLTWIFLVTTWWWPSFNFLSMGFFGIRLSNLSYLILANFFIPLAILFWIYSFSSLNLQNKNKIIVVILGLISVLYEIVLFVLLFTYPDLIGVEITPGVISRTPLTLGFAIFAILIAFIMGIIFAFNSIKSDDPKIRWKGRFLLIAFIFFTLGAGLDAISWTNPIIVVMIRLLLILSSFAYYFGFFLPEKMANWLIKA